MLLIFLSCPTKGPLVHLFLRLTKVLKLSILPRPAERFLLTPPSSYPEVNFPFKDLRFALALPSSVFCFPFVVLIDVSALREPSLSTYFQESNSLPGGDHYCPDDEAVCFPELLIPTYLITVYNMLEDSSISARIYLHATLLLKRNKGKLVLLLSHAVATCTRSDQRGLEPGSHLNLNRHSFGQNVWDSVDSSSRGPVTLACLCEICLPLIQNASKMYGP
jgi:hypothetical protein